MPAIKTAISSSLVSSFDLVLVTWSIIRRFLDTLTSLSRWTIASDKPRFSDKSRATSFSRARMRRDLAELSRAISLFCLRNFLRTGIWLVILYS